MTMERREGTLPRDKVKLPLLPGLTRHVMPVLEDIGKSRYSSQPLYLDKAVEQREKRKVTTSSALPNLNNAPKKPEGEVANKERGEERQRGSTDNRKKTLLYKELEDLRLGEHNLGCGISVVSSSPCLPAVSSSVSSSIYKPESSSPQRKGQGLVSPALEEEREGRHEHESNYAAKRDETLGRSRESEEAREKANGPALPVRPATHRVKVKPSDWLENGGKVLSFHAYTIELLGEEKRGREVGVRKLTDRARTKGKESSTRGERRVRKLVVRYHLEDRSVSITEPKTENSGLLQGAFLKRSQLLSPQGLLNPEDLLIGKSIDLSPSSSSLSSPSSSLLVHIYDCDPKTRSLMKEKMGLIMSEAKECPLDSYEEGRKRERDTMDPRRSAKAANDGISISSSSSSSQSLKLKKYIKYENQVLAFDCVHWERKDGHVERDCQDNTAGTIAADGTKKGAYQHYRLHYFLGDDTIEVAERRQKNDGKDHFPLLLKRQRLPKDSLLIPSGHETPRGRERPVMDFVSKEDLRCGTSVFVYGRQLELTSCDKFTAEFYERELGIKQITS